MIFNNHLTNIQQLLKQRKYVELVEEYHYLCEGLAGENQALNIQGVGLNEYMIQLRENFIAALEIARDNKGKAIYFEYDMENGWESNFFVCEQYYPLKDGIDDWACEWNFDISGPKVEEFSNIFREKKMDMTNYAIGTNLYMIARTVAAFATAIQHINCDIPVCIAFHDQDPIMRIKE